MNKIPLSQEITGNDLFRKGESQNILGIKRRKK